MGEFWVVKQWADYDQVVIETTDPSDAERISDELNAVSKDRRYKFVVMPKRSKEFKAPYYGPG